MNYVIFKLLLDSLGYSNCCNTNHSLQRPVHDQVLIKQEIMLETCFMKTNIEGVYVDYQGNSPIYYKYLVIISAMPGVTVMFAKLIPRKIHLESPNAFIHVKNVLIVNKKSIDICLQNHIQYFLWED